MPQAIHHPPLNNAAALGNIELERAVLGALILENSAAGEVMPMLHEDAFTTNENRLIFAAIKEFYSDGKRCDLFLLAEKFSNSATSVTPMNIMALTSAVGSASNVMPHTAVLVENAAKRRLVSALHEYISKIISGDDLADVIGDIDKMLIEIVGDFARGGQLKHIRYALSDALKCAEERCTRYANGLHIGITTGLAKTDRITGGWQGGDMIILAARPSMGKTAVALSFVKSAAKSGVPVCVYSLEMQAVRLADRMLLSECPTLKASDYALGQISGDGWKEVEKATQVLEKLPIYVDDNPKVDMTYIRAHSRKMHQQGRCGMVVIDYVGLVGTDKQYGKQREQEVSEVSRAVKILAKELNVPVLLLAQLNRANEARADKVPQLSDLRESGSLEQDADIVAFIHRPEYYGPGEVRLESGAFTSSVGYGEIYFRKNRNGPLDRQVFRYNPSMTKISDYYQYPPQVDADNKQVF